MLHLVFIRHSPQRPILSYMHAREKHSDVSEVLEMSQSNAPLLKHASAHCSWFAPNARLPICLSGTHASAKST